MTTASNVAQPPGSDTGSGVIINELLCFVANKLDLLPTETIVQLCVTSFQDAEIEDAKKQLFEMCADETTTRLITRKGPKKASQNMEDIIKMLHEKGSDTPTFVAQNLQALPPIAFNSLDVSHLLHTIQKTQTEMEILKEVMKVQSEVVSDLVKAQSHISNGQAKSGNRQGDMDTENGSPSQQRMPAAPAMVQQHSSDGTRRANVTVQQPVGTSDVNQRLATQANMQNPPVPEQQQKLSTDQEQEAKHLHPADLAIEAVSQSLQQTCEERKTDAARVGPSYADKASEWRTMTKVRGKVKAVPPGTAPLLGDSASVRKGQQHISGSVKDTGIITVKKAVKEKYASVFASRFDVTVTENELQAYLESRLPGLKPLVRAVETRFNSYRSFHVYCVCSNPSVFLSGDVWPEGAYVRWWKGPFPEQAPGPPSVVA